LKVWQFCIQFDIDWGGNYYKGKKKAFWGAFLGWAEAYFFYLFLKWG